MGLARRRPPERAPPDWQRAPARWERPTGWTDAVERIASTAQRYKHFLPPAAPPAAIERATRKLETEYKGKVPPELQQIWQRWNGAVLFDGAMTFFPIGARSGPNDLGERFGNRAVPDSLDDGNERIGPDDWQLTREEGWIVFASRPAGFHGIWAVGPAGRVRLLSQTGEVLGPDVPFRPWLEDQVADLEYGRDHEADLPFWSAHWFGE